MKGIGFRTSLLALTILVLVVSATVMGYTAHLLSKAASATKAEEFWKENKWYMLAPTVMNVVSVGLLAVLTIMG